MERYVKVRNIGKGNMGACALARNTDDGKLYVIKQVDLTRMSKKERQQSLNEAKLLSSLRHPNVINYVDSFLARRSDNLCIVMEFADGGDLGEQVRTSRGIHFSEGKILDWLIQLTLSLRYVHERKILHRDVKTQNVFLTSEGVIKLGDFGIARELNHTFDQARTFVGTPYYLSPELILERPYDYKSDVWALGVVLYEIMALKHPFNASDMKTLMQRILCVQYDPLPTLYSVELRNMVSRLLTKEPSKRIQLDEILNSPIVSKRLRDWMDGRGPAESYITALVTGRLLPQAAISYSQSKRKSTLTAVNNSGAAVVAPASISSAAAAALGALKQNKRTSLSSGGGGLRVRTKEDNSTGPNNYGLPHQQHQRAEPYRSSTAQPTSLPSSSVSAQQQFRTADSVLKLQSLPCGTDNRSEGQERWESGRRGFPAPAQVAGVAQPYQKRTGALVNTSGNGKSSGGGEGNAVNTSYSTNSTTYQEATVSASEIESIGDCRREGEEDCGTANRPLKGGLNSPTAAPTREAGKKAPMNTYEQFKQKQANLRVQYNSVLGKNVGDGINSGRSNTNVGADKLNNDFASNPRDPLTLLPGGGGITRGEDRVSTQQQQHQQGLPKEIRPHPSQNMGSAIAGKAPVSSLAAITALMQGGGGMGPGLRRESGAVKQAARVSCSHAQNYVSPYSQRVLNPNAGGQRRRSSSNNNVSGNAPATALYYKYLNGNGPRGKTSLSAVTGGNAMAKDPGAQRRLSPYNAGSPTPSSLAPAPTYNSSAAAAPVAVNALSVGVPSGAEAANNKRLHGEDGGGGEGIGKRNFVVGSGGDGGGKTNIVAMLRQAAAERAKRNQDR